MLVGYLAVCAIALTWPAYPMLGNSLTPYVLGLPLSLAWNLLWIVLTFAVLVTYHLVSGGEER